MTHLIRRLAGADRPKIIAVIGVTYDDVEAGVEHARSGPSQLPVWAWCAADEQGETPLGCERFFPAATAADVRRGLNGFWPALMVIGWTGEAGDRALKLLPFTVPPFRFVVFNEARGFFVATPPALVRHGWWRMSNALASGTERVRDWVGGVGQWLHSVAYRTRERAGDVVSLVWNILLALLGALARLTPGLAQFAMRRLTLSMPAHAAQPRHEEAAPDGSFTEIAVANRGWPRAKIREAILASDHEFIVFRRHGETGDAEPLIDLARGQNAFAVARQSAWSGWRKTVIAKHPFRRLQPGEATQVFAPYSNLIVFRRQLLLRFGLPRAATFGAALATLFWKADAAGLTSLTLGHDGNITQEPAMELEDAEFVLRLWLSPALRNIAPTSRLRSRGNIARHMDRPNPADINASRRPKPRVLVVSPYLPFPLSHGGAVRIYNLCRALAGEVDFVLACFREANDAVRYQELHQVFREVFVVDADEKIADSGVPAQVAEYRNTAMADLIRGLCLSRQVDLVQIEYTQMAEYRDCTGAMPVILVEHDITFTLHRQIADSLRTPAARLQYERWLAFEREALQCSNAVWTMSGQDCEVATAHGALRRNTAVVPNGVDLRRFQPARREGGARTVLFVGSFRHLPNLLAFEALRETVMPEIWRTFPEARLHVIAGPNHERAASAAKKRHLLAPDPRIAIEGFVEDVRPAYRECDVVAIPLPISAGTNIKLMEAMACGRAIVSTPVGCQGLELEDNVHLLIRDLGPEFAAAIKLLLQEDSMRRDLACSARRAAEARFGWDRIAREALSSYEAQLSRLAPAMAETSIPA